MADSPSPPPGSTEARTNRDSIKKGFNDFVKFADVNITRAKQYVTEKAGKAESLTTFDEEFESLCVQVDQIKVMTERMLSQMVVMIQPNPNLRLEDWARAKLDRPKQQARLNSHTLLGNDLTKASEVFGQESQYGAYLLACGKAESKIGESQKKFEDKVTQDVVTPLKAFLEIDIKSILRERKALRVKRLDLDARRANAKKAQGDKLVAAEIAMREAQAEYEQHLEKVRQRLRKVVGTHMNNMGYIRSFMAAQRAFYEECQAFMDRVEGGGATTTQLLSIGGAQEGGGQELKQRGLRNARMLYDYEAVNGDEISIGSGQILAVTSIPGDEEFVIAEYEGRKGKVPFTYIEYL